VTIDDDDLFKAVAVDLVAGSGQQSENNLRWQRKNFSFKKADEAIDALLDF
jgi:hypothetical protein